MVQLAALALQHWRLLLAGISHESRQGAQTLRCLLEAWDVYTIDFSASS